MRDVVDAVRENPGIELSAHEVLRDELDRANRLDRLIPMYDHLCQIDSQQTFRKAVAASGLTPAEQVELRASPAYGPLLAELRRCDDAGLDVAGVLRQAVGQASLATANDLASVVQARVRRLASVGDSTAPLLGLVVPAVHVSNPAIR
jgi:hypothetical protein